MSPPPGVWRPSPRTCSIPRVLHAPARLTEGAEWVVIQRGIAPGLHWNSRARVVELDRAGLRFGYRSCSDDGNPSYATWTWQLSPADGETKVSVQRELHPETFWRRVLFSRIRHRQLRSELRTSIEAMQRVLANRRETR